MNTTPIAVTRSVLSQTALLTDFLCLYDIGTPVACHFLRVGLNDTYEVLTETDRFILRVYRAGWRTLSEIQYEIDILRHLERKGVPVAAPIAARDGSYWQELLAPEGTRYAVLSTYAQGVDETWTEETAPLYGAAAAVIHNASDDFQSLHQRFTIDLKLLVDIPLQTVLPFLAHRPDDQTYVQRLAEKLRAGAEALPLDQLQTGYCHGDFHGGNAHMNDDKVVTFFDFDCGGPGWRAYDIAVFRWSRRLASNEDTHWPAFLQGYREHRAIADLDLLATPWFVAIRHLWLLGLHTGIANEHGRGYIHNWYWDRALKFLRDCEESYFDLKPSEAVTAVAQIGA
jgi:Ser/Thr protein kinase RdoA (MazF antagonist)